MSYVNAFFGWMWRKKGFFAVVLLSTLMFIVLIFPFSDLSDAVTSLIARNSNNQVYLQFDELELSVIPAPSVAASGVSADLATLPTLSVQYLKLRPAYLSLLFSPLKIYKAVRGDVESGMYVVALALAHVRADKILGGDLDLDLSPQKAEQGAVTTQADIEIDKLDLNRLQEWSQLPVKMQGRLSAEMGLKINTALQEQPEGEFSVSIKTFTLPASPITTPMGPITLPNIIMDNVNFRGRLVNGTLILEDGVFGKAGEPVHGRVKGQMGLRFQPAGGGQITPVFSKFDITLDLNMTSAFEKELGFAFILDKYKTPVPGGNRYLMKIAGFDFASPQITPVSTF